MSYKRKLEGGIYKMPAILGFTDLFLPFFFIMLMTLYFSGCTKDENQDNLEVDPLKAIGIDEIIPADLADSVVVNPVVSVTFKAGTDPLKLAATTISLKKEGSSVPGKTKISGTSAIFTPEADLTPETEYTATLKTSESGSNSSDTHEYSWRFKTGRHHHNGSLSVVTTDPLNEATSVPVTTALTVTFNVELTSAMKSSTLIMLKKGLTSVDGSITFSGSKAIFKPAVNLTPRTIYSGRVKMGTSDESDDDKSGDSYYWSFTTGGESTDVTAPSVISVIPANNAASVATSSVYTVTFSEPMNSATITSSTITLKQGTTEVAGTVTYSGVTAIFTPSAPLTAGTAYTGTVATGVKDVAGNSLATSYSSGFTTTAATTDLTAPTVVSVVPANNATSIATSSGITVTFSEAMNSTSITSSTFTLKQGTTAVAGTVSYSGTTATFIPSAALSGSTVYTVTVTTGAKDAAGNALAANYTSSFTTVATPVLLSFASDVVPVLGLCNNCHTHPWTTSSNASTFYTNLLNGGYVNPSAPTTSKIYTKISGGHPGSGVSTADKNKILDWMTQGSNNN